VGGERQAAQPAAGDHRVDVDGTHPRRPPGRSVTGRPGGVSRLAGHGRL
jgi:hypothetical protein